jgi:hypothetical protein
VQFGLDIVLKMIYKYNEMKNKTIIILYLFLVLSGCIQKSQYNYRVNISKSETKILKHYMQEYNDLNNKIFINGKFVYSNDMHLLNRLKIRLEGIISDFNNTYIPIIIKNNGKYYYVLDYEGIKNINWFNDDEIHKNLSENNLENIEINIPFEMSNLSKEEFILHYLEKESDQIYISKVEKGLFINDEESMIYKNILLLSQIKYGFMVKYFHYNGSKILEVNIEELN